MVFELFSATTSSTNNSKTWAWPNFMNFVSNSLELNTVFSYTIAGKIKTLLWYENQLCLTVSCSVIEFDMEELRIGKYLVFISLTFSADMCEKNSLRKVFRIWNPAFDLIDPMPKNKTGCQLHFLFLLLLLLL